MFCLENILSFRNRHPRKTCTQNACCNREMAPLPLTCVLLLMMMASSVAKLSKKYQELSILDVSNRSCSLSLVNIHGCVCGPHLRDFVTCSANGSVTLKSCFCMTEDRNKEEIVVGNCPYYCGNPLELSHVQSKELDNVTCGKWNRTGQLCAKCKDGFGPLVYSYNLECIPCSSTVSMQSTMLFLISFILLTLFCLIIITLRISGARPPLSTFILISQVMSGSKYVRHLFRPPLSNTWASNHPTIHKTCWTLFVTFFGMWNLDLFRAFFPSICLTSQMTTLQAYFLEYTIGLYPLGILIIIILCVNLYDRGCRVVFCVCRPLHSCLAHLRRAVDVRASLIDAFATFIVLSQNKIGYTSFQILQPVYIYFTNGTYESSVYVDPTLVFFGWNHLLYAIPALFLTTVFILIPFLLLLLYPLKLFQNFLNACECQCSILRTFADTFNGCYKDGTGGTRDYRWFAGLHFSMRFFLVALLDMTRFYKLSAVSNILGALFYIAALAVFQPYKRKSHFKQDILLFLGFSLWSAAVLIGQLDLQGDEGFNFILHLTLLALGSLIPLLYIVGLIVHWLLVVKKLHRWVLVSLRRIMCPAEQMRLLDYTT